MDYSDFEELKQEYISRKELTYSEKLLIEDVVHQAPLSMGFPR